MRRETASLVGIDGISLLQKYNIRLGFFGAHGLTLEEGLTDVSAAEAETKSPLVGMCRQVIAVLDASKWGRVGLASFADLRAVQTVITDLQAPARHGCPGASIGDRGHSRLDSDTPATPRRGVPVSATGVFYGSHRTVDRREDLGHD